MIKCSHYQDEVHNELCAVCTEHGGCEEHCECDRLTLGETRLNDIRERYELLCGRYLKSPMYQLHMDVGELLQQLDATKGK